MASKVNAEKVKTDGDHVFGVWTANPDFKMKEVTLETFGADNKRLATIIKDIADKEAELTSLKNERDDLALKLNGYCTRARSGMKGYFGPNSSEYELAGGTREIEFKRGGARKVKTPETK